MLVDTFSIWIHDAKIFGVPVKCAIWGIILVAIDGRSLTMLYGRQVQPMLEGKPGTKVRLTISRDGIIHHFEVERRVLANGKPPG